MSIANIYIYIWREVFWWIKIIWKVIWIKCSACHWNVEWLREFRDISGKNFSKPLMKNETVLLKKWNHMSYTSQKRTQERYGSLDTSRIVERTEASKWLSRPWFLLSHKETYFESLATFLWTLIHFTNRSFKKDYGFQVVRSLAKNIFEACRMCVDWMPAFEPITIE